MFLIFRENSIFGSCSTLSRLKLFSICYLNPAYFKLRLSTISTTGGSDVTTTNYYASIEMND